MANGDAAAAAGVWTPVLPTDDIRLGYDRLNQLADVLVGPHYRNTRDVYTNAQRLALPTASLFEGYEVIESDTGVGGQQGLRTYRWHGGAWKLWHSEWVSCTAGLASAAAFTSGWESPGFGYTPAVRMVDGDAELRGCFQKTGGAAFVQGQSYWTMSPLFRPIALVFHLANASGLQFGANQIDTNGVLGNYSLKGTTPTWWSLDGFRYPTF